MSEGGRMKKGDRYTAEELRRLVEEMERLFEVVRLLDPAAEEQLTPTADGGLQRGPWDELYVLLDLPHGVTGESRDHRRPVPCAVPSGVSGGGRQGGPAGAGAGRPGTLPSGGAAAGTFLPGKGRGHSGGAVSGRPDPGVQPPLSQRLCVPAPSDGPADPGGRHHDGPAPFQGGQ